MAKWKLPEGRKPLTDADMAALTHRLADTAIEQSELYQAAIARVAELEAERKLDHENINLKADFIENTINQLAAAEARIEELEAKLAKVIAAYRIEAMRWDGYSHDAFDRHIAGLTGGKDE